jgi:hypothetical protein
MSKDRLELGHACDIVIERLMVFYSLSDGFKHDQHNIDSRPELFQYRQERLLSGRGSGSYFKGSLEHRDNYSRLTQEWRDDWKAAIEVIPDDLKLEIEAFAKKGGLRCD